MIWKWIKCHILMCHDWSIPEDCDIMNGEDPLFVCTWCGKEEGL